MQTEDHKQTPTTVRELGIELSGFKELVNERFNTLNGNLERLTNALVESNSNKADQKDLDTLSDKVKAIEINLEEVNTRTLDFVTVKRIVYGAVGIILAAVLGGVISLVVMAGGQ